MRRPRLINRGPHGYTDRVTSSGFEYGIDLDRAAARLREEDERRARDSRARYETARHELDRAVEIARSCPHVRRIRVWGSILRPDRFAGHSDIDICVEGVESPQVWSDLERALLSVVTLPLHLVRWETLIEPHRESIVTRGEVVYESD